MSVATAESMLVALTGSPNCGKTALFNALTGSRQKVANYAGVTVERKEGEVHTPRGRTVNFVDLPGTYSLEPHTPDEKIALNVLLNKQTEIKAPDVLVCVADATNLERSLSLALEVRTLGKPVILALNMIDLADQRGLDLDLEVLSKELLIPVIPTVAVKNRGITSLLNEVDQSLDKLNKLRSMASNPEWRSATPEEVQARFKEVDRILTLATRNQSRPAEWTNRIDKLVLHPIAGYVIFAALMVAMFQAVFTWAGPLMDGIEGGIEQIGTLAATLIPEGIVQSFVVDGIIAGVGAVVVFLPQILILFLFILLFEDSGYMARAAFLMDRLMGKVGLHGRAFIPLLSSFACAIPGIMGTRTIENPRDRLATIVIAPLMTCSARLPVYALLIAAFIPNTAVYGPLRLQGLVMFGLYALSIPSALLVAWVMKKTALKGPAPSLLLELPTYKVPNLKNLLFGLKQRGFVFLKRAGKLILLAAISLWFLATYPKPPANATQPDIHYSYAAKIGNAIQPIFAPLGFDWRISTGLIPGFAAREVMVGALATVFAVEAEDEDAAAETLAGQIQLAWGLPTALALLIWYVFSPQCLATFAVARRETNSWGWTIFMFSYLLGLAYLAAFITYQVASLL